jgi:4a-hydroxytetrahydrobiopterin dehydratase
MTDISKSLVRQKCASCEGGVDPLPPGEVATFLKGLPGWSLESGAITRTYGFSNYHETMAFVNAAAWVSHREDHHPDIAFGYKEARVSYVTHAIGGLSTNDFICAAKLDALFEL